MKGQVEIVQQRSYFDEANVAELGLVSIQERIPPNFTHWNVEVEIMGRKGKLSCEGNANRGGVPHGLDNDVCMALLALYQDAGLPEDGIIATTAYQILKIMGWHTGGHYYRSLYESLHRLATSTYSVKHAWRKGGTWTSVLFHYIENLQFNGDEDALRPTSVVEIRLAPQITESMRANHKKPLNLEFMTSLERPLTRALYRLLDARRIGPTGKAVQLFEVELIAWAEACKMVGFSPFRVRRTLEPAHEELIERGYLQAVEYEGRGKKQTIVYTFGSQPPIPEEGRALVEAMLRYRVSRVIANRLIVEFGAARVADRLEKFKLMLESGYNPKAPAAILVDVIKDNVGKYGDPEGFVGVARKLEAEVQRAKRQQKESVQLQILHEKAAAEWDGLDFDGQIHKAISSLRLLLGRKLSTDHYSLLEDAFRLNGLDPKEVFEQAIASQAKLELGLFCQKIIAFLETQKGH